MTQTTLTWIRRVVIPVLVLIVAQLVYATANGKRKRGVNIDEVGVWTLSDGREAPMTCPKAEVYDHRALKLPKWCKTKVAGVWLSVTTYGALKSRVVELEAELEGTRQALTALRSEIRKERLDTASYFQNTSNRLRSIEQDLTKDLARERFSWSSASLGLATGLTFCGGAWLGGTF